MTVSALSQVGARSCAAYTRSGSLSTRIDWDRSMPTRISILRLSFSVAIACLVGCVNPTPETAALQAGIWRTLPCATCESAHVAIEVQPSMAESGAVGSHLIARVRNLNTHPVVFTADFRVDVAAESDGYVPGQSCDVALSAAATPGAETTLLLGRVDIGKVSISRLERFAVAAQPARN